MSAENQPPVRRIAPGVWLCVALGVFGAAVLSGFYIAAHHGDNPSPRSAAYGVPIGTIRCLSCNLHEVPPSPALAEQIRRLAPDIVFLQEVDGKQLPQLARELGQGAFTADAYYPAQNLESTTTGNAILSRRPLYESRAIPNHMKGACGVWATTVIDDRKFYVACLRLSDNPETEMANFLKAWQALGSPPIIAAIEARGTMTIDDLSFAADSTIGHSNQWRSSKVETTPQIHCADASAK